MRIVKAMTKMRPTLTLNYYKQSDTFKSKCEEKYKWSIVEVLFLDAATILVILALISSVELLESTAGHINA